MRSLQPRRLRGIVAGAGIVLALVGSAGAQEGGGQEGHQEYSAELARLYEADQADRRHETPPTAEQWAEITERDQARRARVLELLRGDALRTPDDYFHAAMILQHGEGSEDILLAHILATVAGFHGHERGRWLSAATLDRYLHRTSQPQRLGTQYVRVRPESPFTFSPDALWSQGEYVRWLPDSLRREFGVDPLIEQAEYVDRLNGVDRE